MRLPSAASTLYLCAIGAFLLSLYLTAFTTEMVGNFGPEYRFRDKGSIWPGWRVMAFGWFGILNGTIAWFANPAFLSALGLYHVDKTTCNITTAIGLLIACTSVFYRNMPADGGIDERISSYGPGFYLWLLSFVLLLVAGLCRGDPRRMG